MGLKNEAILVASNNRKEENEVKFHSRRVAHKGNHSRRDAHKGNFKNYDRIGVHQPKVETCAKREALNHVDGDRITPGQHAIGDEIEAAANDEEPRFSNLTDSGCEVEVVCGLQEE
ncbi:hypothetical protein HPP92_027714, partial [Vanilla planifolia]